MGLLHGIYLRLKSFVLFFLLVVLVPNLPPKTEYPFSAYRVDSPLELSGPLAINDHLDRAERLLPGRLSGPEHLIVLPSGIYTGTNDGEVVRINGDEISHVASFGETAQNPWQMAKSGRPLGLAFDPARDRLIVADTYFGIWEVDLKDGTKRQLISPDTIIDGRKAKLFNSLAVARNGDIFFTDSSSDFGLQDGLYTVLANPSGRLIHYDRQRNISKTLLDELAFANGVLLSPDEAFIVVAETQRARVIKYYLTGPKKSLWEPFISGLPGHPDNLSPSINGFWIPLVVARDAATPSLMASLTQVPLVRKFLLRTMHWVELPFQLLNQVVPNAPLQMILHKWGHFSMFSFAFPPRQTLIKVEWSGAIVGSLHGSNMLAHGIAHVAEDDSGDYLYLGGPFINYIGRIRLDEEMKRMLRLPSKQDKPIL